MLQLPLNIQLDDSARFSNFVDENNRQLVARLCQLDVSSDNFIYAWGAKETGKTHLASAICYQFNQQDKLAAYLPLDNPALNSAILDGMNTMDLVCIDNLDFVVGDKNWEVALFNLYNNLKADNKNLIIFGQIAPVNLTIQLADLKSRFCAMEIYRIEGINDEQKIQFFQARASNRGLDISTEVVQFILSRYSRSVRDLVSILDKLDRSSIALKRRITIPLVKQIFSDH